MYFFFHLLPTVLHTLFAAIPFELIPIDSHSHLLDLSSSFGPQLLHPLPSSLISEPSYAGLIPIRNHPLASLFYWFFPSQIHPKAPLIIWLQGGPFSSSMISVFYQSGPLRIRFNLTDQQLDTNPSIERFILSTNPNSWHKRFNIVYLDQPVGTGYSHRNTTSHRSSSHPSSSSSDHLLTFQPFDDHLFDPHSDSIPGYQDGYVTDQSGVAYDFLSFLEAFYKRFPSCSALDLALSGESYAGKFIPSIATQITRFNSLPTTQKRIPLKFLTIGNQWTDPSSQMEVIPQQLLYFGLISLEQSQIAQQMILQSQSLIRQERWRDALKIRLEMMDLMSNYTGDVDWFDVRMKNSHLDQRPMNHFLRLNKTKEVLHVPTDSNFGKDPRAMDIFLSDIMKSTKDLFPEILANYKVLLYQGNMDLRDGVVSNSVWLSKLKWPGSDGFQNSSRRIWKSTQTGELMGYVNQFENLTRVVLLGCGHRIATDDGCPISSLEMMSSHLSGSWNW